MQSSNRVEVRFAGEGLLAYQVAGRYFVPWSEKPASEALSIDVSYDRTQLEQDQIATATATVRNRLGTTANMVMVDLGIPPGFELLTEDLDSYRARSAGKKSGGLEKFSLTPTQAILYFDSIGPNDGLSCRCDCGRSIRSGRVPSRRECMSITIRRLVRWRGRCNWKSARSDARAGEIERIKKRCNIHRVNPLARNWVRFAKFLFGV